MEVNDFHEKNYRNSYKRMVKPSAYSYSPANTIPVVEAFRTIIKALILHGITLKKRSNKENFCTYSMWDTIVAFVEIFAYIISITSLHYMNLSKHFLIPIYVYITLGLVIRIVLLFKREKISLIITKICSLYFQLDLDSRRSPMYIKYQIAAYLLWCLLLIAIIPYFYYKNFNETLDFKIIFIHVSDRMKIFVLNFIRIAIIISVLCTTTLISMDFILCCNLYIAMRNIIKKYGASLKSKKNCCFSKMELLFKISTYKMCMHLFNEIETSMSTTSFLLYAASVCSFFDTLSFSFTDYAFISDIPTLNMLVLTFLLSVAIFVGITLTGSKANTEYESLKLALLESTENVLSSHQDLQTMTAFKLMSDSIINLHPSFTGGNMFAINMSLFLTTSGAILTYGVVLFQISAAN